MTVPMKSLLPVVWKVPDVFRARLGDKVGRQRAMQSDGHLLLVLHAPPGPDDVHREGRFFWRDSAGTWKATAHGAGVHALRGHLTDFANRVDKLEAELQAATQASDYFRVLQAVAPLHRTAHNLHSTLQQARELFPDDRDLISLRDAAYDLERAAELLHTDAKNAMDFTVARESEAQTHKSYEMSVASHRLNLLVALFFPLATLSAIFGMNISHGLESGGPWMFLAVLAAGFVGGLLLMGVIARRPPPPK